jgi:hypothetical protein
VPRDRIAPALRSAMGSEDTMQPEYQMGEGCLADQLIGQYLADIAGLGLLLDAKNVRKTLQSIRRYNHRETLEEHNSVQRTYALNDEAALLICDYGKAPRPRIPFPYYAEAWTGIEYLAGAQMMYAGLVREGVEVFLNARSRHDGERRNPWDEPECGHHYARAMSAWSGVVALAGFLYHGAEKSVVVTPRMPGAAVRCFWSTGTGWGTYSRVRGETSVRLEIDVLHGSLPCRTCALEPAKKVSDAFSALDGKPLRVETRREGRLAVVRFSEAVNVAAGSKLVVELAG